MKWSFKLGRILGIDVFVHFTFLLLLGFVAMANWTVQRDASAVVSAVVFLVALFGCVVLHEFGHALAARRYGIPTRDITLLPIGGLARLERMPDKPGQELWVALAGPAVNVVIAGALFFGLNLSGNWEPLTLFSTTGGSLLQRLLVVNVFLVLFNMLPAFPMDGGRVLRALLAMRMDYAKATSVAASIGQGMAFLFGFVGLFSNPLLLLIALFVWVGASQEAAAAQMKSSLAGSLVKDAMLTDFRVLSPGQTLGAAAQLILAGSQRDFPVMDRGQVVGILVHTDLFKALRERGENTPVSLVMTPEFEVVEADSPLERAMGQAEPPRRAMMPVVRSGELVGLLTPENIGEFFMIRAALANRRKASGDSQSRVPPVIREPAKAYYGGTAGS